MYPFFVLIMSLALWNPLYVPVLYQMKVVPHEYPCGAGAWAGPGWEIHLCPAPGDDWVVLGSHEVQHIMAYTFLPQRDFDFFAQVAMKSLHNGPYTQEQITSAEHYLSYGSKELHAELPNILHGNLPHALQPWYPWLLCRSSP